FILSALFSRSAKDDPELASLIKAGLTGEDVENALYVLSTVRFASLDAWPEQMEFLFHKDAATRRRARSILGGTGLPTRRVVADRLTAILDDPQRKGDHADAVRALGVLSRPAGSMFGQRENWPADEARKRFNDRFVDIVREGPPELVAPALVAMGTDTLEKFDTYSKMVDQSDESAEFKERIKQARDKIEAEAERVDDRPKPIDPQEPDSREVGGSGGGIF
ncbi:MAG: hypothetical protein H0T51_01465, partial [Pirellulales bacterium]|nr:hypothetical protein [Pirellulales bacterium]